jgi:hypothetical protein
MKFTEALEIVANGGKVTRKELGNKFLSGNPEDKHFIKITDMNKDFKVDNYDPTPEDIFDDTWIEV